MTTEASIDMHEMMRLLSGSPQPNWRGPVSVTVQEGPGSYLDPPLCGLTFHLRKNEEGIHTTTVGPFLRPLLTVSFLAVPGLTTHMNILNTSPQFYTWSEKVRYESQYPYGVTHIFRATTDRSEFAMSWTVTEYPF